MHKSLIVLIGLFVFSWTNFSMASTCENIPISVFVKELDRSRKIIDDFPLKLSAPDYKIHEINDRCYTELWVFDLNRTKADMMTHNFARYYTFNSKGKLVFYRNGSRENRMRCGDISKSKFLNKDDAFYFEHLKKLRSQNKDLPKELPFEKHFWTSLHSCRPHVGELYVDKINQEKYSRSWDFDLNGDLYQVSELKKEKIPPRLTAEEIKRHQAEKDAYDEKYKKHRRD